MYKFIHASDIHLDSPLLNLDQYDGAPVGALRVATREAFDNLVRLAIHERVRFLLIAGDLYNNESRDFNTPIHVRRKMNELREHEIRVLIIKGNHDAQGEAENAFRLTMPENVHVFPTDKPGTRILEDLGVAVHGQSFPQRVVENDLSAAYPPPVAGRLNVGLLHTSCGEFAAHDNYAPSSIRGLTHKGYQYWALGHIHTRNELAGPNPYIVYPGNIQGRSIRETGPKGCIVVTVSDGRIDSLRFEPTDVWRWHHARVDTHDCHAPEDALARAADLVDKALSDAEGRSLAVRVEFEGATHAHRKLIAAREYWRDQLRLAFLDRFNERVWVEKVKFHTRSVQSAGDPFEWGDLIAAIEGTMPIASLPTELRTDVQKLLKNLPTDPRVPDGTLDLDDPATMERLMEGAKELISARLMDLGAPA